MVFVFALILCYLCHIIYKEMEFNQHNKQEYPPMHTAEHILNGTMVRMFGCGRSFSAHIERKKSKCDYRLATPLSESQLRGVEDAVNAVIGRGLPVTTEVVRQEDVADRFDLSRLPDDASAMVRIVHVGDYDECLCVGAHVENTSQIGHFRISSARFSDGVQRIVFRLDE